jgi:hypothetical protein
MDYYEALLPPQWVESTHLFGYVQMVLERTLLCSRRSLAYQLVVEADLKLRAFGPSTLLE